MFVIKFQESSMSLFPICIHVDHLFLYIIINFSISNLSNLSDLEIGQNFVVKIAWHL